MLRPKGTLESEFLDWVQVFKQSGARASVLMHHRRILRHRAVIAAAEDDHSMIARAHAFIDIFREAVTLLGDPTQNERARAAYHFYGLSPQMAGKLIKWRRDAAAKAMHLSKAAFSATHEKHLDRDLAAALQMTVIRRLNGLVQTKTSATKHGDVRSTFGDRASITVGLASTTFLVEYVKK